VLVRAAFADREPLFDIARVESTGPGRHPVFFEEKGQKIETLAPEYTSDGGHLNERGQAVVAKELLNVLSRLTETGG
jgi:lysophospholipase L1-like esterase